MDTRALKDAVEKKGMSLPELALKIGIDKSTLYRKLSKSGETFTLKEADLIAKALNLTRNERHTIFFAPNVADERQDNTTTSVQWCGQQRDFLRKEDEDVSC